MRLGIAIANVYTRGPATLASTAAGLADLAPGRFGLGLGLVVALLMCLGLGIAVLALAREDLAASVRNPVPARPSSPR